MNIERPSNVNQRDWEQTPKSVQKVIQETTQRVKQLEDEHETLKQELESVKKISPHIDEERRQVTIIFADISGFTALNDAAKTPEEVERVVALVNYLLQELSQGIYEFNGYIDKYIGDEIMAIFGAPKAHDNDPELALRAALAMMDRLKKFNNNPPFELAHPLGLHMGINTGTVIAGMVGSEQKRSYTVMGDAVNVAARLEGVSERGQIFVSEETFNLTERLFVFEKRESVMVKGKADPLQVYELKSARERPIQGPESQAPFTGREEELATLKTSYNQLQEGHGGILILSSDAGLGKSRLVQEFRDLVELDTEESTIKPVWLYSNEATDGEEDEEKPLWLFGRGLSYRRSFANRLFVDILYSYLGVSGNADASMVKIRLEAMADHLFAHRKNEVLPYLATMLGLTLDPETAENLPLNDPQVLQQRTFLAVGEWVEALAERQPVIMVFEDLHWADESSVTLIEYLFTLTFYTPILLICATRLERETAFWQVRTDNLRDFGEAITELTLWPLTDHESRQLITKLLNIDRLPKDMEYLLLRRAEGNPLFLEEVLRSLIEQEVIQYTDDHWQITREVTDVDIPNTLQGVLTARIDRLDESVKRVLQIAAVIGRVFPRFVLAPMVNDPENLNKALSELELAELIKLQSKEEEEPVYMFKHVLTHETAYNSMLLGQRKSIHKRIADYMSRLYWQLGEEYAATVAEHYLKSEVWARAFRYLTRAAEAAIQSFFNREAVEFYTRALEIVDKIPSEEFDQSTLITVYQGRAKILARLGQPQEAIADYEMMLAKAKELNDDSAELRALNGIGSLHANYDFSSAAELFQAALAVARRIGDKRGIADTLNQLGSFYANMGELEKASHYYEEARALSLEIQSEVTRIEAEDGLTAIALEQGEMVYVLQHYQEEIINVRRRLGYRGGLIKSLATLLRAQIFAARYRQADETVAEVDSLYKKSGDFYLAPLMRYHQAIGQIYRGQLGQAMENIQEGLELAHKQQQKGWQVMGLTWLGYYYFLLGMNEKCLEHAKKSNELALELGSPLYILRSQIVLVAAYRRLGQLEETIEQLYNIYSVATKMELVIDQVLILYQLARAYITQEAWDKAKETLKQMFEIAEKSQLREYIILAQWSQSSIDAQEKRYQTALNTLEQATSLAEQINGRLSLYLIYIQKSHLHHAMKNSTESKQTMLQAKRFQQDLLDSLPSEELQQAFLNSQHAQQLQTMVDLYADDSVADSLE